MGCFRLYLLLVKTNASCVVKWVIWLRTVKERLKGSQENLMKKETLLLLKSLSRSGFEINFEIHNEIVTGLWDLLLTSACFVCSF